MNWDQRWFIILHLIDSHSLDKDIEPTLSNELESDDLILLMVVLSQLRLNPWTINYLHYITHTGTEIIHLKPMLTRKLAVASMYSCRSGLLENRWPACSEPGISRGTLMCKRTLL